MNHDSYNHSPMLYVRERGNRYRQALPAEILESSESILRERFADRQALNDPKAVSRYLVHYFAKYQDHEVFAMLVLDTQHRLIQMVELSHGTIDGASVYPREVVKMALKLNAAAVIFSHQHPSGIAEPSAADRLLTERLQQALRLVDVRVLDHFVIGGVTAVSFAERGWL